MAWTIKRTIDLAKGDVQQNGKSVGILSFPGDNDAHIWEVTVLDGGEPAVLPGTATAYFMRSYDGNSVVVTGTVTDNVVTVEIPEGAYAYSGLVTAIMRLTVASTSTVTIDAIAFTVGENHTGVIVDPGDVVDVDDILAQYADMQAATAEAQAEIAQMQNEAAARILIGNNSGVTSLDNLSDLGFYQISSGWVAASKGLPADYVTETHQGLNLINAKSGSGSSWYKWQLIFDKYSQSAFYRRQQGGNWIDWVPVGLTMRAGYTVSTLDDVKETGVYYLSGAGFALVLRSVSDTSGFKLEQIVFFEDGRIQTRKWNSTAWTAWKTINAETTQGIQWAVDPAGITIEDDTYGERTNKAINVTGTKLKVVSYNLGKWAFDGTYAEKIYQKVDRLYNLRRWLAQADPDILFGCEFTSKLDGTASGDAPDALKYIFNNRLPRTAGTGNTSDSAILATKHAMAWTTGHNSVGVTSLAERPTKYFRWAMMTVGGQRVLVISAHAMNSSHTVTDTSAGTVADRKNYLAVLFDFVFCLHSQDMIDAARTAGALTNITAPWRYCIIGGDFNLSNYHGKNGGGSWIDAGTDDWDNFAEYRDYYKFDSANGGYLNWITTYPGYSGTHGALDNIMVSDTVMLQGIDCRKELYEKLYSDHLPLEVTVTLLDDNSGATSAFPSTTKEGKSAGDSALQTWFHTALGGSASGPCV